MIRKLTYTITTADVGMRIDEYLKKMGYTRRMIIELKKQQESILCNGKWEYVNKILQNGDLLEIILAEPEENQIVPVEIPLSIVYEDEDILVINKQFHLPTHPSMNHYENTLANGVIFYSENKGESYPFRCVNRLDQDTTGLTVIAKNKISGGMLSDTVRYRQMKREYVAIVEGIAPEHGTVHAPIGRVDGSVLERRVDFLNGEDAITHFVRLDTCEHTKDDTTKKLSLLQLRLETGRTHQIRVHMTSLGHPLIGDVLYNPSDSFLTRQALHAARLSFPHPITREPLVFEAPIPEDMRTFFSNPLLRDDF